MKAKEYILHVLRYFVKLLVLLAVIYALLFVTGYAKVSAEHFVGQLFSSRQGLLLFVMLLVLAAVYPTFGFVRREVGAGMVKDREKIINAFISAGYSMKGEKNGEQMVFRAASPFRKLWMVFDDKVTVTADGEDGIIIAGIRKEVVQAQFRIETYMRNSND